MHMTRCPRRQHWLVALSGIVIIGGTGVVCIDTDEQRSPLSSGPPQLSWDSDSDLLPPPALAPADRVHEIHLKSVYDTSFEFEGYTWDILSKLDCSSSEGSTQKGEARDNDGKSRTGDQPGESKGAAERNRGTQRSKRAKSKRHAAIEEEKRKMKPPKSLKKRQKNFLGAPEQDSDSSSGHSWRTSDGSEGSQENLGPMDNEENHIENVEDLTCRYPQRDQFTRATTKLPRPMTAEHWTGKVPFGSLRRGEGVSNDDSDYDGSWWRSEEQREYVEGEQADRPWAKLEVPEAGECISGPPSNETTLPSASNP